MLLKYGFTQKGGKEPFLSVLTSVVVSPISVEIKPYEEDNTQMDILVHSTLKLDMCRSELAKIFHLNQVKQRPQNCKTKSIQKFHA